MTDRNPILTVDWVTKEAHDAFTKQADYANIVDASRPAFGSKPTVNYVEFEDTKGPLGAPITEFVTFTLKEGKEIAQLEPLVQELHRKLAGTPRFHGDSWAPIIGKPNVYYGILGWDTVEVGPSSDILLALILNIALPACRRTGMLSVMDLLRK